MWLQACLNGNRSVNEHPAVPLADDAVAAALEAIRKACPGMPVGLSTAASTEPDLPKHLKDIASWRVLPDYVSVNLAEPHIERVIEVLLGKGVSLEAGIATPEDAHHLLSLTHIPWVRLLLEPSETDTRQASTTIDAIETVLAGNLPDVPRLLHGTDGAVWALLKRAAESGYVSRVGLEDTLLLPTGKAAPDNEALLRAAQRFAQT